MPTKHDLDVYSRRAEYAERDLDLHAPRSKYMSLSPQERLQWLLAIKARLRGELRDDELRDMPLFRQHIEQEWASGIVIGLPRSLAAGFTAAGTPGQADG